MTPTMPHDPGRQAKIAWQASCPSVRQEGSMAAAKDGQLPAITALESPDSITIAKALATRKGPLSLANLERISPKTLSALIAKEDIDIPPVESLELILEPDGSVTEDFVIPEGF
jgi:hypothetical protein